MTCKLQHYTTERLQLRLWDYCITNKIVSMLSVNLRNKLVS